MILHIEAYYNLQADDVFGDMFEKFTGYNNVSNTKKLGTKLEHWAAPVKDSLEQTLKSRWA